MTPKIAIIGAGPSGLALARCLHVHGIPSIIFDKDPSQDSRSWLGGSLDLHDGSGQETIRYAQLWDEFVKYARYESQDVIVSDETGKKWIDIKGFDFGRPEIDRSDLFKILYASIPPEYFRWGYKLKYVGENRTLHFEDDKKPERGFDLIVGADGGWSKVRQAVCHVSPFYTGLQGVEMWLKKSDINHPELSILAGEGSHFVAGRGDGNFMAMLRDGKRDVQMYVWMQKPETWAKDTGLDTADGPTVKKVVLKELAGWAPQYHRLIEASEDKVNLRTQNLLHVGTRWLCKSNITLMGDAAHVMSIFAGEGVNAALVDALDLARKILANPTDIPKAVADYERELFPRAKVHQQVSWESMLSRFEPSGTEKLKEHMESYVNAAKKGEINNRDKSKPDGIWGD